MTTTRRRSRVLLALGVVAVALLAVAPCGCSADGSNQPTARPTFEVALETPGAAVASSTVSVVADGNTVYTVVVRAPAGRLDPQDGFRVLSAAIEREPDAYVRVTFQTPQDELAGRFYALERSPEGALRAEAGDDPYPDAQVGPGGAVPARAYTKFGPSDVGTFTVVEIGRVANGQDPVPKKVAQYWQY